MPFILNNQDGIFPLSKLFSNWSVSNLTNFCMDDGILPVYFLLLKDKLVMLDRLLIKLGIFFDKELSLKFNTSNSFKYKNDDGISPKKIVAAKVQLPQLCHVPYLLKDISTERIIFQVQYPQVLKWAHFPGKNTMEWIAIHIKINQFA